MGVIISLIVLPANFIHKRREKRKADRIARSYESEAQVPQSQPQSRPPAPSFAEAADQEFGQARVSAPVPATISSTSPATVKTVTDTGKAKAKNLEGSSNTRTGKGAKMASDEDYMAFLNKANQDPNEGVAKSAGNNGKLQLKTLDAGEELPEELKAPTENEEWIYISDADEAFVGVCLKTTSTKLPDEKQFAKLVDHPNPSGAGITIQDVAEWDSRGQYKDVVDATRKAAKGGDVRVYRVPSQGARVEYWVVGIEKQKKRLVGAKVLAVES